MPKLVLNSALKHEDSRRKKKIACFNYVHLNFALGGRRVSSVLMHALERRKLCEFSVPNNVIESAEATMGCRNINDSKIAGVSKYFKSSDITI